MLDVWWLRGRRMNDFTKDELQIIHLDMCTYVQQNKILKESPSHKALRDKVEAMIDKYCEHDCKDTIFIRTVTACSKCDYPIGAYRGNK